MDLGKTTELKIPPPGAIREHRGKLLGGGVGTLEIILRLAEAGRGAGVGKIVLAKPRSLET